MSENLSACSNCGGPVLRQRTVTGTAFHTAVDLNKIADCSAIDIFIFDRLRRAERIIEDLRKQLSLCTPKK